jgi:hypothetical protein
MLNLMESVIVGFAGLTASESAAVDGPAVIAARAQKNRNFLKNTDSSNPPY